MKIANIRDLPLGALHAMVRDGNEKIARAAHDELARRAEASGLSAEEAACPGCAAVRAFGIGRCIIHG